MEEGGPTVHPTAAPGPALLVAAWIVCAATLAWPPLFLIWSVDAGGCGQLCLDEPTRAGQILQVVAFVGWLLPAAIATFLFSLHGAIRKPPGFRLRRWAPAVSVRWSAWQYALWRTIWIVLFIIVIAWMPSAINSLLLWQAT